MNTDHDTIVAPATAAGGAIAVIRISGGEAFAVCDRIFRGRRPLAEADGYTVHYGTIAEGDRVIDDVLACISMRMAEESCMTAILIIGSASIKQKELPEIMRWWEFTVTLPKIYITGKTKALPYRL